MNDNSVLTGRSVLTEELRTLSRQLVNLEEEVNAAILRAGRSMTDQDVDMARRVIEDDLKINQMAADIEKHAFRIIALQNPIATDLRQVITVIRMTSDLERMADHAKNIAKVVRSVKKHQLEIPAEDFLSAMRLVNAMLLASMDAYLRVDAEKAVQIAKQDRQVDAITDQMAKWVVEKLRQMPEKAPALSRFYLTVKSIERMGDYVANLCEWIVYLKEGDLVDLDHDDVGAEESELSSADPQ